LPLIDITSLIDPAASEAALKETSSQIDDACR
jgi:isopenicillin N synthase-like dioxygenase